MIAGSKLARLAGKKAAATRRLNKLIGGGKKIRARSYRGLKPKKIALHTVPKGEYQTIELTGHRNWLVHIHKKSKQLYITPDKIRVIASITAKRK